MAKTSLDEIWDVAPERDVDALSSKPPAALVDGCDVEYTLSSAVVKVANPDDT